MLKKLGIIALLALVIIPASVMAGGYRAGGGYSGAGAAGGQQYGQHSGANQVPGQYSYANKNGFEIIIDKGNGTLSRTRAWEQIQERIMTQLQDQNGTPNQLQNQLIVQNQLQTGNGTGDQLQARDQALIHQQLGTLTGDQLRIMARNQSRLMTGPAGTARS